jgi:hypothetical protein
MVLFFLFQVPLGFPIKGIALHRLQHTLSLGFHFVLPLQHGLDSQKSLSNDIPITSIACLKTETTHFEGFPDKGHSNIYSIC